MVSQKCYYHNVEVLPKLQKYVTKENLGNTNKCSIRQVIVSLSSNTFIELKEHKCFVPIDQTMVTSQIRTQIRCVTISPSNTFTKI
jgi:hypothetical protein